jgi:hypothetical protein
MIMNKKKFLCALLLCAGLKQLQPSNTLTTDNYNKLLPNNNHEKKKKPYWYMGEKQVS